MRLIDLSPARGLFVNSATRRKEMLGRIQADGNQTKLGSRTMSVDKCPEAAHSGTKLSQPQLIVGSWRGI
jgi:hypothetical protein